MTREFEIPDFRDQSAYDMTSIWRDIYRHITVVEFNQLIRWHAQGQLVRQSHNFVCINFRTTYDIKFGSRPPVIYHSGDKSGKKTHSSLMEANLTEKENVILPQY